MSKKAIIIFALLSVVFPLISVLGAFSALLSRADLPYQGFFSLLTTFSLIVIILNILGIVFGVVVFIKSRGQREMRPWRVLAGVGIVIALYFFLVDLRNLFFLLKFFGRKGGGFGGEGFN